MKTQTSKQGEEAIKGAQTYFATHPGSPSAVRRPRLRVQSGRWIASLGRTFQERIIGIGTTVEAAFRSFDAQYLAALRPPGEKIAVCSSDTHLDPYTRSYSESESLHQAL